MNLTNHMSHSRCTLRSDESATKKVLTIQSLVTIKYDQPVMPTSKYAELGMLDRCKKKKKTWV